jgi:ubiE/COQ5 methyltransferase family
MPKSDKWSQWLAETRFGADSKTADRQMRHLRQVRDHLLKKAGLEEGKVVLDVGAGEGLIGFGALERIGITGRVVFSDISEALLDVALLLSEIAAKCTIKAPRPLAVLTKANNLPESRNGQRHSSIQRISCMSSDRTLAPSVVILGQHRVLLAILRVGKPPKPV